MSGGYEGRYALYQREAEDALAALFLGERPYGRLQEAMR